MNWSDPIVDEVRRVRDAYAARFNYDLRAIVCDLKEQEKLSGRRAVSYAQDGVAVAKQPLQPTEATIPGAPGSASADAAPPAGIPK